MQARENTSTKFNRSGFSCRKGRLVAVRIPLPLQAASFTVDELREKLAEF
jgi:hypothetical protein